MREGAKEGRKKREREEGGIREGGRKGGRKGGIGEREGERDRGREEGELVNITQKKEISQHGSLFFNSWRDSWRRVRGRKLSHNCRELLEIGGCLLNK